LENRPSSGGARLSFSLPRLLGKSIGALGTITRRGRPRKSGGNPNLGLLK
jgi:hypothetical protein